MASIKITKSSIDKLPPIPLGKSQVFYRDSTLPGFGIYVGKTSKTYFVERWMKEKGGAVRHVIGKHGAFTPDQARKEAQKLLGKMATGANPNLEKRAARIERVTLQAAYADYLSTRSLKERTKKDYNQAMERAFPQWRNRLITEISKDMIRRKYSQLVGKRNKGEKQIKGEKIGPSQANQAMRFLKALLNFAKGQYENGDGHPLITYNPVDVLSQTRAWQKVSRRRNYIDKADLPAWLNATMEIKKFSKSSQTTATICDYLLLILFTGLRKEEAMKLRWKQIDFGKRIFTITDTKNSEPLALPLSDFLYDLLAKRKEISRSEFVFPGKGDSGHIVEPKRQIQNITKASGVKSTIHDLRRTFITTAESLDIPAYALKALLNHKISGGGVTQGYIVITPERLRHPMQKITDNILSTARAKESGKIIEISKSRKP